MSDFLLSLGSWLQSFVRLWARLSQRESWGAVGGWVGLRFRENWVVFSENSVFADFGFVGKISPRSSTFSRLVAIRCLLVNQIRSFRSLGPKCKFSELPFIKPINQPHSLFYLISFLHAAARVFLFFSFHPSPRSSIPSHSSLSLSSSSSLHHIALIWWEFLHAISFNFLLLVVLGYCMWSSSSCFFSFVC